jgi:beta-lactamase class A
MKRIGRYSLLRWVSLALILAAAILLVFQLIVFSRLRSSFPTGTTIAGVDVTGLSQDEAATRLSQVFSIPVEMHYQQNVIQVKPSALGFSLDLTGMMTAADQSRVSSPFWSSFFGYLFNQLPAATDTPLRAKIDETRMRDYLETEIAARYDVPPSSYAPVPGSVVFQPGTPGTKLDIDQAIDAVSTALRSPTNRVVDLKLNTSQPTRPSLENLRVLLRQIVDTHQFTGEVEIYMQDLQTGNELQMAYRDGEYLPVDIAFSAESTIKIAIMVAAYQKTDEPASAEFTKLVEDMITKSDNLATDELMRVSMDPNLGPIIVTQVVRQLGLQNTFLDGMFYVGAPLLTGIRTPANTRQDVNTDPDPYNQTTPTEIGTLLSDLYQCAQTGGGSFGAVFPGEISQDECKTMLSLLTQNRIGTLIEAGLPDGTQIGHKHGWAIEADSYIHTIGDVGIVFTPGGNYVLSIYIHDTQQIIWDDANRMYADLSRAVYNYFNLTSQ